MADERDGDLGALFDRVPSLAGSQRSVQRLDGGLTNCNYKVSTPDGTFVARVYSLGALLAINRDNEYRNTAAAARRPPHGGRRGGGRGRARDRVPARGGRPGDRLHRRPHVRCCGAASWCCGTGARRARSRRRPGARPSAARWPWPTSAMPGGAVMTAERARAGRYHVNVDGELCPARVHLRPPLDPAGERIRGT